MKLPYARLKWMLLAFLMTISARAFPQQQPQGAISGTVVRADTGEPVPGVQVVVRSPDTNLQPATTTTEGKFSFSGLNAGTYRLIATATGFVRQEYGQRAVNGPGRPVSLMPGQIVKDAVIRLTATGTVSGRIYDENGEPATGASVQLLRVIFNAQGRNMQSAGADSADDRGEYRIHGVPPGRYFLVAGTPPGLSGPGRPADALRFSVVYYPNAGELDQASSIEVRPGIEVSFNMGVRRQPQTYRVRGHVINSTGVVLPPDLTVMLGFRKFATGLGGAWGQGRTFDPVTGRFELKNVPPGDYIVQAEIPPDSEALKQVSRSSLPFASTPIRVVDADIDGVVVNLTTGVTVPGQFVAEGSLSVLPNLQQFRLAFSAGSPQATGIQLPTVLPGSADGSFQVQGLREGEYRVVLLSTDRGNPAARNTSGFYAKSVRYGGEDILTKPFKFEGSGTGTFEIVLRAGAAQLSGTVIEGLSQPVPGIQVALIPEQRYRTDLYRPALTDQTGKFSFADVVPGDYKLFSWEALDTSEVFNPEFLTRYETQGVSVHIAEFSAQSVSVRLIPAP